MRMNAETWNLAILAPAPGLKSGRANRPRKKLSSGKHSHVILLGFYALLLALYLCSTANAKPTQQDVFRSIEDNVSESNDSGGKVILFVCGGIGLLLVLTLFGRRQQRAASPKPLHHHGKLLKEVRGIASLRKGEIKQLKLVAEQTQLDEGEALSSPLVLLLCPSALARVVQDKSAKADRKVLAQVIRRVIRG